ncbi:dienelactone hydrolase family protein [Flagellimonas meridianipacifica]|uniref:Dienelactone hydrolase family protein n=1 Tax=Flagellimonas meridianipacifica TaxID=1080225 RepID=A0A2T0MAV2_9FLAO|nr:dienelactone hydrolase family protein [Allomuricauda pacifica]PRX54637.1 dienelactone hydrolase family protein [Allomuricauda pacifica]
MSPNSPSIDIRITVDGLFLPGILCVPEKATGIVVFSHGSGSSRLSTRNNFVAEVLQKRGLATLLFDLLTEDEDNIYENRFNIDLLTVRLVDVIHWVQSNKKTKRLSIGIFGASTGSASALRAAAFYNDDISAVVSRGGRPDLAMTELHKVTAPTLFLVGGWDTKVIELNKKAYEKLKCESKLKIIPEASHLFGEPGKLEEVAKYTGDWFKKWL